MYYVCVLVTLHCNVAGMVSPEQAAPCLGPGCPITDNSERYETQNVNNHDRNNVKLDRQSLVTCHELTLTIKLFISFI